MILAAEEIEWSKPAEFPDEWREEPWKHHYHYKNRSLERYPELL